MMKTNFNNENSSKYDICKWLTIIFLFITNETTYAALPLREISCKFHSEKASEYAETLYMANKVISEAMKRNDQKMADEFLDRETKYIEKQRNIRYQANLAYQEKYPESYDVRADIGISNLIYAHAELLSHTQPYPTEKLTFERLMYEDCIRVGIESEAKFNNSPAEIERIKEMNRRKRELNTPKPQPQQPQNVIVNPSRPLNCVSQPDGPGSTRMITTCF